MQAFIAAEKHYRLIVQRDGERREAERLYAQAAARVAEGKDAKRAFDLMRQVKAKIDVAKATKYAPKA